ncbi:MFS transporter [Acanthopleuribacter pedis]|uniref:MFS transporter n=1 Tax=Acanthopleuribacter pedis TaxID=442870 RepID=A0A8J7Q9J9_9BACT|nr:MFS transporter [Acanthopleuribacter pedis]MBO1319929.1 MFS transporter [Acanthopleuribacter pedis]
MTQRRAYFVLFTVMLITVLGTAGIALPYPVLAPYFLEAEPNQLTHFLGFPPKLLLGVALGIYPLGLLVGGMFIGALSDEYGRKRVLLITMFGSVLGYLATAAAVVWESYLLFLVARFMTGLFEGNIAIARAIALELHPVIDRTKAISLTYATVYAGWLVGPLAGGYLAVYGEDAPFLVGAVTMVVSMIVTALAIEGVSKQEGAEEKPRRNLRETRQFLVQQMREQNSLGLLKNSDIHPIFWYYFAYAIGLNMFYEFYPIWMVDKLGADSRAIGWGGVVVTAAMILMSTFWASPLANRFGQSRTMLASSSILALLFFMQPLVGHPFLYAVFAFIGATIALGNGLVPTYLSENFGRMGEGRVMGLQTTVFCLTNIVVALFGSLIALLDTTFALWLGAVVMGLSMSFVPGMGRVAARLRATQPEAVPAA